MAMGNSQREQMWTRSPSGRRERRPMARVAAAAEVVTAPRLFATGRSAITRWSGHATVTDSGMPPPSAAAAGAAAPAAAAEPVAAAPESDEPILLRRICSIARVSSVCFFVSFLGLGLVYLLVSRPGFRPASPSARGSTCSHFHFPGSLRGKNIFE